MNTQEDILTRQRIAQSVQMALKKHRVNPEDIGKTIDFLANVLGGIIGPLFPSKQIEDKIGFIKEQIVNGIEMGIPEE
jgi:hypothetical protein